MNCRIVFTLLAMMLMATVAIAASDIDNPDTPGYGQKVIDLSDTGYVGYGAPYTNDDAGNGFTFGTNTGNEKHLFYAFEVPTGSAVMATGNWYMSNVAGWGFWAEHGMWTCDDLNGSLTGLTPMSNTVAEAAPYASAGVSGRAAAYVDTNAPDGIGYDYYEADEPDSDQFWSCWNYFANAQHLGPDGSGSDLSYNKGAPTYAKMDAWAAGYTTTLQDMNTTWAYAVPGGPNNSCMKDAEAPAGGVAQWKVTRGSGDTTQGVVVLKLGGDSNNNLTIQDWTLEVRGPADATGDKFVDVADLGVLATNYGLSNKGWTEGDFNGDGVVDVSDLGIMATNYGGSYAAAAVPEPTTLSLLGLGALSLMLLRRSK